MPKLTPASPVTELADNVELLARIAGNGVALAREVAEALGPGPARDHVIASAAHLLAAVHALAPVASAVRQCVGPDDDPPQVVH